MMKVSAFRLILSAYCTFCSSSIVPACEDASPAKQPRVIVGTHHDFMLLPNGHLIVPASELKFFPSLDGYPAGIDVLGDVIIDLDRNRKPVWIWSTFDHLDVNRHPMGLPDWAHSNTIVYSPDDHNLILSMRNQSWVIKIDYNNGKGTGNILWKLGIRENLRFSMEPILSIGSTRSATSTLLALRQRTFLMPPCSIMGIIACWMPVVSRAEALRLAIVARWIFTSMKAQGPLL